MASLDLKKAFDRVRWRSILAPLREQGVQTEYQKLIMTLYTDQVGFVPQGGDFRVQRGVRHGVVLSTLLFNAVAESAIRKWKAKLKEHGIKLRKDMHRRLTNVRLADDLIIYASSKEERKW